MQKTVITPPFDRDWTPDNAFEKAFAVTGKVFRQVKNRTTIRFEAYGEACFIKIHRAVGWREILKNLGMFKRPVCGARNEFLAIRLLEKLQVPTMKLYVFAERGVNPAARESFLITQEVTGKITLEDFCADWKKNPPDPKLKNVLIRSLAETVAKLHFAGLNHRDCYLCHFMLDKDYKMENGRIPLTVMDLHRAEIRAEIPRRMRVKDLAGIFFSSMDSGLTKRDAFRFMAVYSGFGKLDPRLWRDVLKSAVALYRKEWKRDPVI